MKKYHISRIFLISVWCILMSGAIYATINYAELFPNGSTVVQSQVNGWTTPLSWVSKEVMTPEGCQKITSTLSYVYHIPTRSMAEWVSFRDHLPSGVSVASCIVAINAICGWSQNTCIVWSPSWYSAGLCGWSQTWSCLGTNGWNNVNCSIANNPCLTLQYQSTWVCGGMYWNNCYASVWCQPSETAWSKCTTLWYTCAIPVSGNTIFSIYKCQ
jgi:hypothetical protein